MLHSPFFGSGKLEYYLAARRPALAVRGVDAFEPVANLRRCFLRSLLRLAGRKVDRRFYFSRLLPGTQRGRAGRRAACSYVLLRNSFSRKWGSFAQQRPLALNIFPGRSMNYYGTRRRGHDLTFHSELRDALFASGLPFLLSINDVPEAWELYSRAGSITRLCSGKNSSKPELLVLHQGNPVSGCRSRIEAAILCPTQDCQGRTRPAPGPHQARTRPQSDIGLERGRISDFAFPSLLRTFRPQRER